MFAVVLVRTAIIGAVFGASAAVGASCAVAGMLVATGCLIKQNRERMHEFIKAKVADPCTEASGHTDEQAA